MRRLVRSSDDGLRLGAFVAGLLVVFIALASPLDSFDALFVSAHMTQHLLLIMIAPALVLLGRPVVPLLRGLPKAFVKEGLGPFLTWPALRRILRWLVSPLVAWILFAVSTITWHVPKLYQLAVRSPSWHELQHACFFWTGILFWWPVIEQPSRHARWPRWAIIPYLLFADILNTALSALFVFSGRVLYPIYESVAIGKASAQDDQTLAGVIMWVPGSLVYLIPVVVIAVRLLSGEAPRERFVHRTKRETKATRFQPARLRPLAQLAMLLITVVVVWDGFRGPEMTAMNAAGVLPWIHWRALSLFALLIVGNLFCMACPFTFVRDIGRRVLPANRRWPRLLRTKWLAAGLFAVYLIAYEAFDLWDSPWLTAWIIVGYFGGALLIDGLFRGATFCKYVCPIGQFHFIASLVSPREVRVRNLSVCKTCKTHDCIRGNEHARGCELYLFQPKKASNLDCTFCLDCVNACPHDNVSLIATPPASTLISDPYRSSIGRLSKRSDIAALALLIVLGAFANAAGMVVPFGEWQHQWPALIGALLLVAVVVALSLTVGDAGRRFIFALVPVGVAMWAAHLLFHFVTGCGAVWPIVDRAFSPVMHMPIPSVPAWLTSAQVSVLDAGLLLTMYVGWRIASQHGSGRLRLFTQCTAVSICLYAAGVWILFQPMQMRGMMH